MIYLAFFSFLQEPCLLCVLHLIITRHSSAVPPHRSPMSNSPPKRPLSVASPHSPSITLNLFGAPCGPPQNPRHRSHLGLCFYPT